MAIDDELVPITPINFVQLSLDCMKLKGEGSFPLLTKRNSKKFLLLDTAKLCGEESFAEVAMGWNEEGLEFYIDIDSSYKESKYPNVTEGDCVELFIDTRDVKTTGFNTKFCHHFFFLAEGVDGKFAGELTHFRTEDAHPLCDPNDLKLKVSKGFFSGYALNIFIPKSCLQGYEPTQFKRLGFSYRINRSKGFPQHFSVITDDYQVDQQPSLWASLNLVG